METARILEWATIIGASLVLTYIAIISTFAVYYIDVSPDPSAPTIKVVGKQWAWEFVYSNGTRSGELVVNRGEIVNLELVSEDVVHSFYVRVLGLKLDAVPGTVNKIWLSVDEPGVYDIQCAEYCGLNHYIMRANLRVI